MMPDSILGMPVLVVDDEPTNTKLLAKVLAKAGYTSVVTTNDARQTVALFNQHRPGVILLDLNMPHLDGFTILEQLRAQCPTGTMPPVVVLTAQDDFASRLKALQGGARDFVTKPFNSTELLVRIENMLGLQLAEQERLRFYAHYDIVTGLPNRNYTLELLRDALNSRGKQQAATAVLVLGVQQFKRINQSFGYETGDELLRVIKARLQRVLAHSGAILGRLDGARFLIALPNVSMANNSLPERIQAILAETEPPVDLDGIEIHPTLHVGAAVYPDDAAGHVELLARAESALTQVQQQSEFPYAFSDLGTDARMREQLRLEAELHRALERKEFFLVYQPQFQLDNGRLRGVEALLRWRHPNRGVISPAAFIPLLEQTGLILEVGEWLLNEAFRQTKHWHDQGLTPPLRIAVNLSPRQFAGNDLVDQVRAALVGTGLCPTQVELEVTESLLVEDFPGTLQILEALEAMGIRIALDDFGTGYSALTYLHAFPFHALKIDKSFVSEIGRSAKSEALLAGIIALGKSLHLEVVAEGIETPEQRQHLQQLGCDIGQGFGLGRPQPPEAIYDLLLAANDQVPPG